MYDATSDSLAASFDGVIPVDDFHSFTSILGGDNYSYNGSFWAERQSAPFAISSDGRQISVAFDGSQLVVN
ncbi:MAG: hypothetical protein LBL45_12090 [Treponema sp.]|nr:hypothetical protein [Treponema sp.]